MAHASTVNYAAAARAPPPKQVEPASHDTRGGLSLPARDTRLKTTVRIVMRSPDIEY